MSHPRFLVLYEGALLAIISMLPKDQLMTLPHLEGEQ